VRAVSCGPDVGTLRDEDAELPEDSTDRVDAGGSSGHPTGPEAMQPAQRLLVHGLQGDGVDLLVSGGLKASLGIGAVGLVAGSISYDMMGGKEFDGMDVRADLPPPAMCGATCFHENDRGGRRAQPAHEARSGNRWRCRTRPGLSETATRKIDFATSTATVVEFMESLPYPLAPGAYKRLGIMMP
jgi:hypothetical protein